MELQPVLALRFLDAGNEPPHLTIYKEPDLGPPGYKIEIPDYAAILKPLGRRLRAKGLSNKIVVSDGWIGQDAILYMWAALVEPEPRQHAGALAYHGSADGLDHPSLLLHHSAASNPPHATVQIRPAICELGEQ